MNVKAPIVSILCCSIGFGCGYWLGTVRQKREASYAIRQSVEGIESSEMLAATRSVRVIEFIESGDTNVAIKLLSYPIADYFSLYGHQESEDPRSAKLLQRIRELARTNSIVAERISETVAISQLRPSNQSNLQGVW